MNQNLIVRLAAQGVGAFKAQMAQAAASVKQLGDQSSAAAAGQQAAARKAGVAMAAVGVATVAAAAASAKAAIDLEKRMANVATIWDQTAMSIGDATDMIGEMSTRMPQSANVLAEALYDVASSGFQGAEAMKVAEVSAMAASAGLTDAGTAVRGVTAVLNAYGMGADQASRVSDVLFQTVNLGVITFEQLANTMGDFVGSAAVAGVSIEEANAALATMTLSGVSAAESGTSLNRVLQELIKPNEDLLAVMGELGVMSGQELLEKFGGLAGAVEALNAHVDGNATAIATLFPEMRALRGFLALNAAEGENYRRVLAGMTDEEKLVGATRRALNEQSKSTSYQMTVLVNTVKEAARQFGQSLLPVLKGIIGGFTILADAFMILPDPLQKIVAGVGLLAGLILGLGGAFLLLAPNIAAASAGLTAFAGSAGVAAAATTALGAAVKVALGPIGWITAAVGVAVGAFAMWAHGKMEAKRRTDELKTSLDASTGAIGDETIAVIRNRIAKDKLDEKAKALGVSVGDLAAAMLGDEAAIQRVNDQLDKNQAALAANMKAADEANVGAVGLSNAQLEASQAFGEGAQKADELRGKIKSTGKELKDAKSAWERDKEIKEAVTGATADLVAGTGRAAGAFDRLTENALTNAEALGKVADALSQTFNPQAALSAAEDAYEASQSSMTDTADEEIRKRYDLQREANDKALAGELKTLEARDKAHQDFLAQEHKDRQDAIDLRQRDELEALDVLQRAEKDALKRSQRDRKQALDDVFRAERHAMDRRLDLLDEEYDKQRKNSEKAFEARKEELEWIIRTSWGAQREQAIADLAVLEDTHDAELRAIDRAQDDEVNLIRDGQEDSEEARQNAQDDTFTAEDQALSDRLEKDKQFLTDRQAQEDEAETVRYDKAKEAWDAIIAQDKEKLDEKYRQAEAELDRLQELENRKADERRSAAKTKHEATLAEMSTQLDTLNATNEQKLADLKTIWERSGRTLSGAMLTELAALPPGMIKQLADAGQPSFDAFMGKFKTAVEGVTAGDIASTLAPFNTEIQTLLGQAAEAGGVKFMENIAKGLSNDPAGAEKVRQALLALWTSPQGVLMNPQTGLRAALNADGSITGRQAMTSSRPILWGEAGLEAYIPMRQTGKHRSTMLLAQVADYYGYGLTRMANGGITAGGGLSIGGDTNYSVTVGPITVAAGVDPGAVGLAVRREVERAFVQLGRQVTVKAWRN